MNRRAETDTVENGVQEFDGKFDEAFQKIEAKDRNEKEGKGERHKSLQSNLRMIFLLKIKIK